MAPLIRLDAIRTDGDTQARVDTNYEHVDDLAEAILAGAALPQPILFNDGGPDFWPGDGHHRIAAYWKLHRSTIEADVRRGGRRDAMLFACSANAAHGLRRTRADKKKAIEALVLDVQDGCLPGLHKCGDRPPEERCWSTWSSRDIARHCHVDHKTVEAHRPKPHLGNSPDSVQVTQRTEAPEAPASRPRTFKRNGRASTMNTTSIGGRRSKWVDRQPDDIKTLQAAERSAKDRPTPPVAASPAPATIPNPPPSPRAPEEPVNHDIDPFADLFCNQRDFESLLKTARKIIEVHPNIRFAVVLQRIEERADEI
jgi:hypothetical protein